MKEYKNDIKDFFIDILKKISIEIKKPLKK